MGSRMVGESRGPIELRTHPPGIQVGRGNGRSAARKVPTLVHSAEGTFSQSVSSVSSVQFRQKLMHASRGHVQVSQFSHMTGSACGYRLVPGLCRGMFQQALCQAFVR